MNARPRTVLATDGRRRPPVRAALVVIGLCIGLAGAAPPPRQDAGAEPEDARAEALAEIESLLDQREWKDALKAIKSYRRRLAKSDEEKAEADFLEARAEGSMELAEIEETYRKKQHARRAARDLGNLIREYREHEDIQGRARELLAAARSTFVMSIEDFEDWKGADPDDEERIELRTSSRMTLVEDPKYAMNGDFAGRWRTGKGWVTWSVVPPDTDWTGYDFFCCWIFNEKLGPRPGMIEIEANSGGGHYFMYLLAVDWTGWKEIRMPLRGKTSRFARHGGPEWNAIERLEFDHDDDTGTEVDIIIDDIRLEKAVR